VAKKQTAVTIPTVNIGIVKQEYGTLIYDIPAKNTKTYDKVKRIMGAYALPMNLSVYLIPWGSKGKIEDLLKQTITHDCDIKFIKFDTASAEELEKTVEVSLRKLIDQIYHRITEKIQEIRSKSEGQQYDFKYEINKRISDVEVLTTFFGMTQDIAEGIEAVKKLYQMQVQNIA
jgi:hypothetical protein